jgi:hypothetical protein
LDLGIVKNKKSEIMNKTMFTYTKNVLERVSFDPLLFYKEVRKALKVLLPYEIEQLRDWLLKFTEEKPELQDYQLLLN